MENQENIAQICIRSDTHSIFYLDMHTGVSSHAIDVLSNGDLRPKPCEIKLQPLALKPLSGANRWLISEKIKHY